MVLPVNIINRRNQLVRCMRERIITVLFYVLFFLTALYVIKQLAEVPLPIPWLSEDEKDDITPIPGPTPAPIATETLTTMLEYDYVTNSLTGLSSRKLTVNELQNMVKNYGTVYGYGMPLKEYLDTMEQDWICCTDYDKEPEKLTVDITETIDYTKYVDLLKKLSRYEGVNLYIIGKSTDGRDIYAVEIDVKSDQEKKVLMFTGQIHAREFAGGTFLLKQLVDLVQKAQNDEETMEILKKNKYVAVPIINVDGREALITNAKAWTTKKGELWKAYINGTDGNRNFPGLLWGQVSKGNKKYSYIANEPGYAFYAGDYAGSNLETKALMKWIYHYTVIEKASCFIDLHQQGAIVYAGKDWSTKEQERYSNEVRSNVLKLLNQGNKRKYVKVEDEPEYGFRGTGSTITDYAASVAYGAKFSPAMGFCAYTSSEKEYMLMEINDLDKINFDISMPNKMFTTLTLEIGYGRKYLGNSEMTRKLLAEEYEKYHFDQLLETLPEFLE